MVRIRLYAFTLSLPLMLVVAGGAYDFIAAPSSFFSFTFGSMAFEAGILLQCVFALGLACPRCGKSPYAIGPTAGPFALAGKPIPDRKCSRCGYDLASGEADITKPSGQS